jgi:pilus assembly protein CpaB
MRAKTILTVLFLISLGVAGIVLIRALPQLLPAGAQEAAKDEILVATAPLAAGTLLRPQDVAWQRAKGDTEPGQIVRPDIASREVKPELDEEVRSVAYGAALRKPLAAGDPIRRDAIVKPGDRDFLQLVLSPGTRAIVIPVHMVGRPGANSRFLGPFPGDRVDVILTQKFKQDLPLTRSSVGEAIVENLRVLAIAPPDPKDTTIAAAGPNSEISIPLTLEVTPEQAEKITVARELGKLDLTLRSVSAAPDGIIAGATSGPASAAAIKPIWAGDVSPALGGAMPPKLVTVERPPVDVIHGNKSEHVSTAWHPDRDRADRDGKARSEKDSQSSASDDRGPAEQR